MFNEANGFFGNAMGIQTNPFSRRTREKGITPMNNIVHRQQWMNVLRESMYELLASRFEWQGLPESMPIYYLEKILIKRGQALIFETKQDGMFVSSGTSEGLNHYHEPLRFTIDSPTMNGTYDLNKDKCVIVKNNTQSKSDIEVVESFVRVLAEIQVTKQISLQTMKTPFILKGNERTMRTLYEQLNQIAQGQTHIMIDEELAGSGAELDVLSLNTPYYLDKLHELYIETKSELLEMLGVNTNPNPRKKERMISGEVETNQQEILMNRMTRLRLREDAAKKASKIFGKEITVKLSEVFEDDVSDRIAGIGYNFGNDTSVDEQNIGKSRDDQRGDT